MAKQQNIQPQQAAPRKIGAGVGQAALRQGFKELGNALKAFPDAMPQIDEPGQMFNLPPQAVSQQTGYSQPVSVDQRSHNIGHTASQSTPEPNTAPVAEQTSPQTSPLDKHLNDIGATVQVEPNRSIDTPTAATNAPSNSLLDQHLTEVQKQSPEQKQPELEMEN